MAKKEKYNCIFSLGAACSCTDTLRNADLQFEAYPFDWLYGASFSERVNLLISDFENYINLEHLEDMHKSNGALKNPCNVYKNNFNHIIFNHDFPENLPLEKSYPLVKEKYNRRINRLLENINHAKKVLVVYIETPNAKPEERLHDDNILVEQYNKMKNRYPNQDIYLLYFQQNFDLEPRTCEKYVITENITKIISNYKSYKKDAKDYDVDMKFMRIYFRKNYSLDIPLNIKLHFLTKKYKNVLSELILDTIRKKNAK